MWKCQSCKAWSSNSRSLCFGCGSVQGGPATCSGACECSARCWIIMSRQQSLSTLSTTVGTETVESARSKKVLKKHLQRSIGELVAAKEQLPEEEGREVAQGITDRIKALQLQKDGLMSVARKKKGFCATRGVGKDTRIQAQSPTAGTGGFGRSESKTSCCSRGMCKRGTRNRRGGRPRRGDARRGPEQHKGSLPRLVQLVRLYFTVKRVERDAHSDFADLRYPCTSAKNSSPCCCGSWYDGETAADSCTADRCTCGGNCKLRRPDRVSCPCNSKAASDGSRGGTRSSRYDSSWKLCRRCHECTEPFSQHIRTAQTVLANKYAEHWCSLPESKEMVGEAEAPMNSILSVGQLRSRVSSCVHLPLLFQLSPGAVSDMWCGAVATDDDTVWYIEIFTDGSSLIPKAWPRVAASGGWGVLVSAICDNQRIAVTGMFFGDVTVSSGHPFFLWCEYCSDWCVRNSSNLGGLGLVSRCQRGGQECHNQTRQYVSHWSSGQESLLHFTRAIGACYEALSGECKKQVARQLQTHQGTSRAVAK